MASLPFLPDPEVQTATSTRQHSLDALRAGALLLGIVLHSLLPFLPGLPWLVSDSQGSWLVGIPVYVIHLFRMVLFMLLAGYLGRLVVHRHGPGRYLRDRLVRILLPFVVFWPIAVLSLGALAVLNAEIQGIPLSRPPEPAGPALLSINPGQLWFLLVLLQCVVLLLTVRAVARLLLGARRCAQIAASAGRVLSAPGGVVVACIPYLVCLLMQGNVLGGIIAPVTLLPSAAALTAYIGAFGAGWALHAGVAGLVRIARLWPTHLGGALVLSALGLTQSTPTATAPLPLAAAVMALAAWCWVYALLGLCVRFLPGERPVIRYLADGSYWMYLIHLPLLVGFEIMLVPLDLPIALKLAATWLVVGAVLILTYHFLVRSTPLGRWLNGRRYPRRWSWNRRARWQPVRARSIEQPRSAGPSAQA